MEKKKKFVSDEEFHAALELMRPWWDEAVQVSAISDESNRRSKSRDYIARWSSFRNQTIGDAWGRIYPLVIAAAINGKKPLETVRMLLEKHQARLASAWKQGCELTGVEPPLHDEIARRDQMTGSIPKVVELLDALRQKLDEVRAAKPVAESDDFIDNIKASADTEAEKKIKWVKDVLFDYDREEGDFSADNRRQKREDTQAEIKARKEARQAEKAVTIKGVLADVPENTPTPTPQPTPDPRVELEDRVEDLEAQLATAKINKVEVAKGDDDEALTAAMAVVSRVAVALIVARAELAALDTTTTPTVTVQPSILDKVLARVGDFTPPKIDKEKVQKALEAFVASAEKDPFDTNSHWRLIKKFLDDPNKRPEWIVGKALNTVSKGTVVVSA